MKIDDMICSKFKPQKDLHELLNFVLSKNKVFDHPDKPNFFAK